MNARFLLPFLVVAAWPAACARRAEPPAPPALPPSAEPAGYQGPTLVLDSPARGDMLFEGGAGPWPVTVRGRACDPVHRLVALRIDGVAVPLSGAGPCFPFAATVETGWGLTVVTGEARNDAGQVGTLAQGLLRSPDWFPAGAGPDAAAPGAIVVQIGPSFLDDGDRSTPDELATLLERALGALDLDAAAGPLRFADPDADGDGHLDTRRYDCLVYTVTSKRTGFELWKSGPLSAAGVRVERLALAPGGIEVRASVTGLGLPFAVTGNLDSGCLGAAQDTVSGVARADALTVNGVARVGRDAQGAPAVAFGGLSVTLTGLTLDVDLGPLDFTGLGSAIGDAVVAQVRGPAQEALQAALRSLLEERLRRALATLSAFQREVALPAALGGGRLLLEGSLEALDFTAARGVLATSLRIFAAAPLPGHPAPRGAMRLGGGVPDASGLSASAVAVGLADDALNQLLFAAWQAGAFDLARAELPAGAPGLPGARLSLDPRLPPMLVPRPGGAPWMDLALGDVAFALAVPAADGDAVAHGFLSALLPVARVEVRGDGLALVFDEAPRLWVELSDVNWDRPPLARTATAALLERALAGLLPGLLEGALRPFPIPGLDLGSLDPSLAGISVSLGSPQLSRLGRHQFLAGDLVTAPAAAPQPPGPQAARSVRR